ncbi:3'(2'),5'-bisphosphate nucleotidase CysQ [Phycicoccus sp. Soil748]|uniref:3'(2'),5'-bisphosphate nucleotidase CysQ n=1 Tax=Intrasporangiaceae TaxID=85021 RepID=UPI000702D642|nr:3'(2'),5'-bisphosphate nucleotidase CysQ [Phycicoccus sp. Soil748]KRE58817.1 3'(2'),5'-bisphosphate nucleotidase CysQ [Phycicoccus sp. Soil748]
MTALTDHGVTALAALDDHRLARALADAAGEVLLALRSRADDGVDPAQLKADGDRQSHLFLMDQLAAARPDDAVLSEEGKDDPVRLRAERVWIIDPLDGTREFGEVPRDDWAVHVALWERGDLVAGAVARPARGSTLATDDLPGPPGPGVQPSGRLRLAVSRSRPPAFVARLAERLDAELVPMGSAGIKATAVVDGTVDAYVHAGGQYEWDSAAPVAVARAAGLHTSRIDGSPLEYNREDPLLPDLLICRPEVADHLLTVISELNNEGNLT